LRREQRAIARLDRHRVPEVREAARGAGCGAPGLRRRAPRRDRAHCLLGAGAGRLPAARCAVDESGGHRQCLFAGVPRVGGLVTSAFFFVSRDIAGTIVFHNFLGTFGVVQALSAANALSTLERLQPALILTAAVTAGFVAAGYIVMRSAQIEKPIIDNGEQQADPE
jgi:hypothetical protein